MLVKSEAETLPRENWTVFAHEGLLTCARTQHIAYVSACVSVFSEILVRGVWRWVVWLHLHYMDRWGPTGRGRCKNSQ